MAPELCRVLYFIRKSVFNIGIFALVVFPTPIYRQPNLNKDAETNDIDLTVVHFRPYHLFCSLPELENVTAGADQAKILDALRLPNGSLVSESVEKLGRCMVIQRMTNRPLDDCGCEPRPAYIILLVACVLWQLIDYVRFCNLSRDAYRSTEHAFRLFDVFGWLAVVALAGMFHAFWFDDVWLPTEIHSKPYFQRPLQWTLAVCFAIACWISYMFDFMLENYFDDKKQRDTGDVSDDGKPVREEEKEMPSIDQSQSIRSLSSNVDADASKENVRPTVDCVPWNVVSYSDEVIERLSNWRIVRTVWNKTYP